MNRPHMPRRVRGSADDRATLLAPSRPLADSEAPPTGGRRVDLKSTLLTPQFILALVVAAVWCYVAIGGIADGDDVFVVLIGFAIKRAARED
jgi:hypothetical protein